MHMLDYPTDLLFEDEEIIVVATGGRSTFALVTFGDLVTLAKGRSFYAETPVRKAGFAAIGFMAKRPNWFPASSVGHSIPAVLEWLAPFLQRVLYGGSMGGYAALKYSGLIGATEVIAYCPQWSIDPDECSINPGWQQHFMPKMRGMGISRSDVRGVAYIFFDPLDAVDAFHAKAIGRIWPQIRYVRVPGAGHHVTTLLAGTQNLIDVVDACRSEDNTRLIHICRRLRRTHRIYQNNILAKAARRYPATCLAILRKSLQHPQFAIGEQSLFALAGAFSERGSREETLEVLKLLHSNAIDIAAYITSAILYAKICGRNLQLRTYHNTVVVFSPERGQCIHVPAIESNSMGVLPVRLKIDSSGVVFYSEIGLVQLTLGVDTRGMLVPDYPAGQDRLQITLPKPGAIAFAKSSLFMSAEQSGLLVCSRAKASSWELFDVTAHYEDGITV